MEIKRSTKKDIKEIAKLMLREFSKPPFNENVNLSEVLKSLNFFFKIGKIFVALDNHEIIGILIFKIEKYWEGSVIIVEDLVVKEKYQKQGVGKTLMIEVENFAKRNKIKRIIFKTHKDSKAKSFYKKLGYIQNKKVIYFDKKIG